MAAVLVAGSLFIGSIAYWYQAPANNNSSKILIIKNGWPVKKIAATLKDEGLITSSFLFVGLSILTSQYRNLKAGEYEFPAHVTPAKIIDLLTSGRVVQHSFTVVEGQTSAQVMNQLNALDTLEGSLSLPSEGSLLPETYSFPRGTQRETLIKQMQQAMTEKVKELWIQRPQADYPLADPQELIILASIIEKETARADERSLVASVFLNRLLLGMPLQADPTVVYALQNQGTSLEKPLTQQDLKLESPYNTYLKAGLPPGPIANPGFASLYAAAHPATTKLLYFVADGKGGHVFSGDIKDHQKHHQKWREIQKLRRR